MPGTTKGRRFAVKLAAFATFLAWGQGALPQSTSSDDRTPVVPQTLQPVTITAERHAENIKDVPVSASTLAGDVLDAINTGGQDLQGLASRAPSLNVESSFGRAFPRFYLRGYGNVDFHQNASQPVSVVYDDIVLESPVLKGFPIFDLDGIEVLRGPQGTQFGRNTPAGVVKFNSAAPDFAALGGYLSASDATHHTNNIEGAINIPLSSEWAARLSILSQHRDDFIDNSHTGQKDQYGGYDDEAARLQFLYQPNRDFSALLNFHTHTQVGSASLFRANIIQPGSNNLSSNYNLTSIATDGQNGQKLETYGTNLHLRWNLGEVTLSSVTGLEKVHVFSRGDIDGGFGASFAPPSGPGFIPFPVESADGTSNHHQFTEEVRLESNGGGPFGWQTGVYYFDESYHINNYSYDTLNGGALTSFIRSRQQNKAYAVFGSAKYALTDRLEFRGGVRYTRDDKDFSTDPINQPGGTSDVDDSNLLTAKPLNSRLSYDGSVVFKLTGDTSLYARAATGFRGTTIQPAAEFNAQSIAAPETVVSYEGGIKSDLFDRNARVSFDIYRYDVKNQQLTAVGGVTNSTILVNAKKTLGEGAELDFQAYLLKDLLVTLGGSYNYTRIKDPNLSVVACAACTVLDPPGSVPGTVRLDGNPLPQAPRFSANLTARYGIPYRNGEFFAFTDWTYRS